MKGAGPSNVRHVCQNTYVLVSDVIGCISLYNQTQFYCSLFIFIILHVCVFCYQYIFGKLPLSPSSTVWYHQGLVMLCSWERFRDPSSLGLAASVGRWAFHLHFGVTRPVLFLKKNYINVDLYSLVSSWWQMHCGIWYCGVKVTCMATTMIWSASRRLCGEWVLHWCLPASSSLETMSIVESMALRLSGFFILILKYAYKFKNEQRKSRVYCSL